MSSSSRFVAGLVAIAVATTSFVAQGQTDDDKEEAKALFSSGIELRGKGDDAGALAKFEAAYKLVRSPITTLEYCRSLMRAGRLVEARDRCIEATDLPAKSTESQVAKDARRDAKSLAADITPRIPRIKVKLDGAPPDAEPLVSIDGHLVASSDLPNAQGVDPGKHHVSAKLANGDERSSDVEVKEGDAREVILDFKVTAAKTSTASSSTPDGPSTRSSGTSTWTYVGFGAAGVGVVGAVVGGVLWSRAESTLTNECMPNVNGRCTGQVDTGSRNTAAAITIASLVVVGAGIVVGVASLSASGSSRTSSAQASLNVGPGWIGLSGRW